ncbi:hypothetical protein BTVI_01136 [Pitangus sulphuratus]|nr:hypothetical protein BTVI_01136 [Pitangus sulphuratus]
MSLTGDQWQKHSIVTEPEARYILGMDYLKRGYFKDPKEYRWAFGVATVIKEKSKQLSALSGLSKDPSVVGLLRVKDQQVPIATATVHRRQYKTNRDAVIPIRKIIRKLESQGVINRTHSPFNSPIWPEWKHSPTICHGLIQATLEKNKTPEHLQYINDIIVWGNTVEEIFGKEQKIIQILLEASFTIKKNKVKRPTKKIQFLGVKWQDKRRQIPRNVINKIVAMTPPTN